MRTGRASIHVCCANRSVLTSLDQALVNLGLLANVNLSDILDVDALAPFLTDLQILRRRIDQIMDLFHVDLDHGDFYLEFHFLTRVTNLLENVADHAWNHTSLGLICDVRTQHGVRLARTGLSISEHCAIESLHYAFDNRLYSLLIDEALRRV